MYSSKTLVWAKIWWAYWFPSTISSNDLHDDMIRFKRHHSGRIYHFSWLIFRNQLLWQNQNFLWHFMYISQQRKFESTRKWDHKHQFNVEENLFSKQHLLPCWAETMILSNAETPKWLSYGMTIHDHFPLFRALSALHFMEISNSIRQSATKVHKNIGCLLTVILWFRYQTVRG